MAASPNGMTRFYTILGAVAVVGIGLLGYQLSKPATVSIPANVTIQPADTAGFRGYLKGSDSAAVEITEFADYQCPFCQTFATLQMPTIDERLIQTGRLRWRYRDFPLQQHPYSRIAAHSAACADEQGKFWPQHERIYEGQSEWADVPGRRRHLPPLRPRGGTRPREVRRLHVLGQVRGPDPGELRRGPAGGRELDADPARGRPALPGPLRFRRHYPAGRFPRAARHQRAMIYRMGAALMSLVGVFVSAYLYLYKIGRIGTLACGTRRVRDRADERSGADSWASRSRSSASWATRSCSRWLWSRSGPRSPERDGRPRSSRGSPPAVCCSRSTSPTSSCSSSTPSAAGAWARPPSSVSILILALLALRRAPEPRAG